MLAYQEVPRPEDGGHGDEDDSSDMQISRADKIRNVMFRDKVGVTPIEDNRREARLIWFGHIRRSIHALVRRCEKIHLSRCRRG